MEKKALTALLSLLITLALSVFPCVIAHADTTQTRPKQEDVLDGEDVADIPDACLRARLREITDKPPEEPLRLSDLSDITGTLDLRGQGIVSAQGLQYCVNADAIDLAYNQLTALPDCSALTRLKTLDLSGNLFDAVPEGILGCAKLRTLHMNHNNISALPGKFARLSRLATLSLKSNQLGAFPAALADMPIETLNISDNPIGMLPDGIADMRSLRYLYAAHCGLSVLPEKLYGMDRLRRLSLENNGITSLSGRIDGLAALEYLDVSGNRLSSLPDEICKLKKLRSLILSGNEIGSLPENIGDLKLTDLYASANSLCALPASLVQIRGLKELDARLNRLNRLPEGLNDIRFAYLNVEWNFIDVSEGSACREMLDDVSASTDKLYLRQLTPVRNLIAHSLPDGVALRWDPCADGAADGSSWKVEKYVVYAGEPGDLKELAQVTPDIFTYIVQPLNPSTIYTYTVGVEYRIDDIMSSLACVACHYACIQVKTAEAPPVAQTEPSPSSLQQASSAASPSLASIKPLAQEPQAVREDPVWLYAALALGVVAVALTAVNLFRRKRSE